MAYNHKCDHYEFMFCEKVMEQGSQLLGEDMLEMRSSRAAVDEDRTISTSTTSSSSFTHHLLVVTFSWCRWFYYNGVLLRATVEVV